MNVRDRIYLDVEAERLRQEDKWGFQHHGRFEWANILMEEVGEVSKAGNDGDMTGLRAEIVQVAAVAVAWLEDIDTAPSQRFYRQFGVRA